MTVDERLRTVDNFLVTAIALAPRYREGHGRERHQLDPGHPAGLGNPRATRGYIISRKINATSRIDWHTLASFRTPPPPYAQNDSSRTGIARALDRASFPRGAGRAELPDMRDGTVTIALVCALLSHAQAARAECGRGAACLSSERADEAQGRTINSSELLQPHSFLSTIPRTTKNTPTRNTGIPRTDGPRR
jgi:hypothetical protein